MEIMWLRFSGCYGFLSVAVFWRHACGKLLFWKYVHVFEKLPFFVSVWFIVVNLCFLSSPNNMLTSLKTCSSFTTVWLPHNFILTKLWTWTLFREVVHFINVVCHSICTCFYGFHGNRTYARCVLLVSYGFKSCWLLFCHITRISRSVVTKLVFNSLRKVSSFNYFYHILLKTSHYGHQVTKNRVLSLSPVTFASNISVWFLIYCLIH